MNINILFRKPIFIILLILAIFSFLGSLILSILKQNQEVKPNSLPIISFDDSPDIIKLKFNYQGQLPKLEEKSKIYQFSKEKPKISQEAISQYGINFGFSKPYQFSSGVNSDVYFYSNENTSLIISTNPDHLEYGNYNQATNNVINQNEFIILAKDFLNEKQLISSAWNLDKGYVQYLTTDFQGITIPTQNFNNTKYVEVSFNYLLDGLAVVDKLYKNKPIDILFNIDGSVRIANVLLLPDTLQELGGADTATPQQALEAINNGQGTFSRLNNPEVAYTEIKQGDMSSATFNTVELVYVYDYYTGSIQPFYRFQGYGYTKDGDKIEVGVIITALPQELYQK